CSPPWGYPPGATARLPIGRFVVASLRVPATNPGGRSMSQNENGRAAVQSRDAGARQLEREWSRQERWSGVRRTYSAADVIRLRGSPRRGHTVARHGAERLWRLLHEEPYVAALGAISGNQAVQMVQAGVPAVYVSGWQVAADANLARETYPDQSLYPAN